MKKFIIDLNDNEELKKIENNKIEINEKVIVSIQEDLKNKAIIECRLTKLLTKLSDENREITIENNNQEYQIELDYINFKKFTVKDLIKKEKINFINLNSINLTIKRGFYKIINTVCKEMIIKNETIRSIEFSNVKLDNIVFESLKLNRLKFENSEINQINFKKLEFSEDFSIKNSKVNEISIENICVYNFKITKNTICDKLLFINGKIKETFSVSEIEIKELNIDKSEIEKVFIKKLNIGKSFKLTYTDMFVLDVTSSGFFQGDNFRINNCNIGNAKFESIYFSSATTQFYYDKNIEKSIDNIIFKNCIFNSEKITFSNGKYNLISFYESIFDTYLHFSPDHVKYVDFDKSINNKVFKFNYNFDSLDIIDFTDFINQGDFIIYGKDYILNTINRENLYNKIINFENHRKLLGIYDDIYEVINNKCNITKYSEEEKKKYTRVNALIAGEILNENKMYDIEDYFYSKYHKLEYGEGIIGKIELKIEAFLKSIFRFFEKRNLLKNLENHVYNISNYGESYSKIILHMLLFIFKMTALIILITNYIDSEFLLNNTDKIIANMDIYYFFKIFYFTVITFFTVGYGELTPSGICLQILVGLTAFAGIFFSAYLIAVFTRKMMRK